MNTSLKVDFSKQQDSLVPAVIQHAVSARVLMLGYMNSEALEQTIKTKKVTFFSRSKGRLWVKGESSSHFLELVSLSLDCDNDAILIQALPQGPTCHLGTESCFSNDCVSQISILSRLEQLLAERKNNPVENSYTSKLLSEDIARTAQKVGEEGVEVALASVVASDKEFIGEVADLWFHSLVLLTKKGVPISDIFNVLIERNKT